MGLFNNRAIKFIIGVVAVINIVAMMGFDYGLPSYTGTALADGKVEYTEPEGESEVGTIEAVEQEVADKEEKEAETALAKEEKVSNIEENDEEIDPEAPVLELTDDHIFLKVGDRFNYMSYIRTMEDVDGSDLSHYIYLDRDVDTSVPGEIELTYRITSTITGKSTSKVLTITVTE